MRKGDRVPIQRSTGEIEFGWEIIRFDADTGDAVVQKVEKGKRLEKQIPQAELINLIGVLEAKDFVGLFKAIDKTGGVESSDKFFEVDELKRLINEVRTGVAPLDILTPTSGLRQKVADLLKIEILRKLEELLIQFKTYAGGSSDQVYTLKKFVSHIEAVLQLSPSQEEAEQLKTLIQSYPSARTCDFKDADKLRRLRQLIERMTR